MTAAAAALLPICAGNSDAAVMLALGMAAEQREFTRSQTEWCALTGLNRWKQETARAVLRERGFWHETVRGIPARLYYRIDVMKVLEAIGQEVR